MQRFLVGLIVLFALCVAGLALFLKPQDDTPLPRVSYEGIAQKGAYLGNPRAPIKVTVFVDTQCPACARFEREALPGIVRRYVKTGRAYLYMHPVDFLGPDSLRGSQAALAAADQNRMWPMVSGLLESRQTRNSGYTTNAFLTRVAVSAGINPRRLLADIPGKLSEARALTQQARRAGVKATPSFLVEGPRGSVLVEYRSPKASELADAIDGR